VTANTVLLDVISFWYVIVPPACLLYLGASCVIGRCRRKHPAAPKPMKPLPDGLVSRIPGAAIRAAEGIDTADSEPSQADIEDVITTAIRACRNSAHH
jgi:hypothetical protein